MNRNNKKGFNVFAHEMPFVLPQPIPEPPRVLNPRPMVPDLSITSESTTGPPLHQNKDYLERFKTYLAPPQRDSPPIPDPFGRHFPHLTTNLIQNDETNANFGERLVPKQTLNPNRDYLNHIKGFDPNEDIKTNAKKNIFTNGRPTEDKPIESQYSGKPKIIRHPMASEAVTNRQKELNNCCQMPRKDYTRTDRQTNCGQKADNSPTNEQMYEIIRQQDIQLQKISEQIEELLKIHKIEDKREENISKNSNKRSVQTMTSIILSDVDNRTDDKSKTRVKSTNNTPKTPSTASKDLRALRLNTISESSEPSKIELDSNRLNFSESPVRRLSDNSSIERMRANDSNNSYDDPFYGQMLNDIELMLNNGSSDDIDSGRRSSCSPTPPHSRRPPPERRHRIELQSEQTLYIKRLAAKYLVEDSEYQTKPKYRSKRTEQKVLRNERTDLNVYGLTKNASIETKNYLEKYGLTYSPPKVNKNVNFFENNRQKHKSNRNKILDIEALKRQHKLT